MVSLILGNKGTGKTKRIIDRCVNATQQSKGNVIMIEKGNALKYNVDYKTRLVSTDEYGVRGFDAFYGFVSGMYAGDFDITDIFIDSTLKIGGGLDGLDNFIDKLCNLSKLAEINIVLTISADKNDLSPKLAQYAE